MRPHVCSVLVSSVSSPIGSLYARVSPHRVNVHTYIHTHTHIQTYTRTHTHIHRRTHVRTYTQTNTHTHTHTHTYTHKHTHTHTHTLVGLASSGYMIFCAQTPHTNILIRIKLVGLPLWGTTRQGKVPHRFIVCTCIAP